VSTNRSTAAFYDRSVITSEELWLPAAFFQSTKPKQNQELLPKRACNW